MQKVIAQSEIEKIALALQTMKNAVADNQIKKVIYVREEDLKDIYKYIQVPVSL